MVPFFAGVIKSIAWDWRIGVRHKSAEVDDVGKEDQSAVVTIDAQKIVAPFGDDPIAQKMLIALMDGAMGKELQEISGLTKKDYESKRTKIRWRLEKLEFWT